MSANAVVGKSRPCTDEYCVVRFQPYRPHICRRCISRHYAAFPGNRYGHFRLSSWCRPWHDGDCRHVISMDPPSLVICLNNRTFLHDMLLEVPEFAVSILTDRQVGVSEGFSGKIAPGESLRAPIMDPSSARHDGS